jgi:pSer/pThr/pTyr-binding forkhead associated (FHA) protein
MSTPRHLPIRLVALDGGPDLVVDRPLVVVGRDPRCDARLDSRRVSRRHCCLAVCDGLVLVADLGSTNGTRVNGRQVRLGCLAPGDELAIGLHRYRLESGRDRRSIRARVGPPSEIRADEGTPPSAPIPTHEPIGGFVSRRDADGDRSATTDGRSPERPSRDGEFRWDWGNNRSSP